MASTSVLGSVSNATVSVFDTLANTATAVTKLIDGTSVGANMYQRLMSDMDNNHRKRSVLNQALYEKQLLEETSMVIAKRQASLKKNLSEDSTFASLFAENYAELEALLNPPVPE